MQSKWKHTVCTLCCVLDNRMSSLSTTTMPKMTNSERKWNKNLVNRIICGDGLAPFSDLIIHFREFCFQEVNSRALRLVYLHVRKHTHFTLQTLGCILRSYLRKPHSRFACIACLKHDVMQIKIHKFINIHEGARTVENEPSSNTLRQILEYHAEYWGGVTRSMVEQHTNRI